MKAKDRSIRPTSLGKVVRDKIPDEIRREGRLPVSKEPIGNLKQFLLRRKAIEEIYELCHAQGLDDLKEEMADVLEVLHAIAEENKLDFQEIERVRVHKHDMRGGFDRAIFIEFTAPLESETQYGLFGPLDYMSIHRKHPRLREAVLKDEELLRLPLVPTFIGREFRVGRYAITYTETEILVRILPEKDERQYNLFPADWSCVPIPSSKPELENLLSHFEGFWKLYGMLLLRRFDFPTLDGLIISTIDSVSKARLNEFAEKCGSRLVLLRHDRAEERIDAPRGGFLVPIDNIEEVARPFLRDRRILILLEPANPYEDEYSCNAWLKKGDPEVILEIVGPGFDASDINRQDTTPHEILRFGLHSDATNEHLDLEVMRRVSDKEYRESVQRRLVKIGRRLAGYFDFGYRGKMQASDTRLSRKALRFLRQDKRELLLQNRYSYRPMDAGRLREMLALVRRLAGFVESGEVWCNSEVILSMSFVPKRGLVCWDLVWQERKYATWGSRRLPD